VAPTSGEYAFLSMPALPFRYLAPESLLHETHGMPADVWMFACVCWVCILHSFSFPLLIESNLVQELWTGKGPHADCEDSTMLQEKARKELLQLDFETVDAMPAVLQEFLLAC